MRSERYYYISALPGLGELGSVPPMGFAGLMERVGERPRLAEIVGAVLLFDDLLQRQGFLCREISQVEPAVLSPEQARNESPLPEYLLPRADSAIWAAAEDGLWDAYFRHVAGVARAAGCRFLAAWVGYQVGLRNALASARARRLGLEEAGYLVAVDLADPAEDLTGLVGEWAAAASPLAGWQALLRGQWEWLDRHDPWFSFSEDEFAVYAARLVLLHQWRRVSAEPATPP